MYFQKYSLLFTFVFFTTTCFCQSEKTEVKATLAKFKTALEAENYSEAVSYADSATINYYDTLLPIIKHVDSATLISLPLMKKLMVLNFRHRDTALNIRNFDGKQLLAFAMKNDMVSYNNMVGDSIHVIHIQNELAKVVTSFKSINNGDTLVVQLIKEHEKWKISFITGLSYAETLIRRLIQESGKLENEFIFSLLENISGTTPSQEIWHRK